MRRLAVTMATVGVLVSGLGWSGAALAQDAAAPAATTVAATAQDDPVNLELARQLVEVNGGQAAVNAQMKAMFATIDKSIGQYVPADQNKLAEAMRNDIEEEVFKLTPRILDISVHAYAETYTTQELRDLLAFQMSESGRAIARKTPIIRQQVLTQTMPLMMAQMPEIMRKTGDRVCAEVKCTPAQRQVVADAMAKALQRPGG
jgi:hypothetical protein